MMYAIWTYIKFGFYTASSATFMGTYLSTLWIIMLEKWLRSLSLKAIMKNIYSCHMNTYKKCWELISKHYDVIIMIVSICILTSAANNGWSFSFLPLEVLSEKPLEKVEEFAHFRFVEPKPELNNTIKIDPRTETNVFAGCTMVFAIIIFCAYAFSK